MATNLLHILQSNADKTPDEIVAAIRGVFSSWRRGNTLTREEYNANRDVQVVLVHCTEGNNTELYVEKEHKIGAEGENNEFYEWTYEDWASGVLRNYYFRSLKSYEDNPGEGFISASRI